MPPPHPLRLGILSTHPIQYFAPLYRHLARRVEAMQVAYQRGLGPAGIFDPGFGRNVVWGVDLHSGYDAVCFDVPDAPFSYRAADYLRIARRLRAWVRDFRPDVVLLPGWFPSFLLSAAVLAALGVPMVVRPDAQVPAGKGALALLGRDLLLRRFLGQMSAAAVTGGAACDELLRLGFPPERLFDSPFSIDTDRWVPALAALAPRRDELRARHGFAPDDLVYLSVSRLIPVKRPDALLRSFAELAARAPQARLVLVGSGELLPALQEQARAQGLGERVRFAGFADQTQLPEYYALADVFLLFSSLEPWGLVVNEAMHAGLPLLVTEAAGAAHELVLGGVTGYRLRVERPEAVLEALLLVTDRDMRERMRAALAVLARRFTLEAQAEGIVRAAVYARQHPR